MESSYSRKIQAGQTYSAVSGRPTRWMPNAKESVILKILVIGDPCVGKTSYVQRYVNGTFHSNYKGTIGVDFALKIIRWGDDGTVKIQLWDIAGQERYTSMTRVYYRDAYGCLVMFDLGNRNSFLNVVKWKNDFDSKCVTQDDTQIPCILLANKADIGQARQVTDEEIERLCNEFNFDAWAEVSVKGNSMVEDSMKFIISRILNQEKGTGMGQSNESSGAVKLGDTLRTSKANSSTALGKKRNLRNCPFPGLSTELAEYLLDGAHQDYDMIALGGGAERFVDARNSVVNGTNDMLGMLLNTVEGSVHAHSKLSRNVLYGDTETWAVMYSKDLAKDSLAKRIESLTGVFDWQTWLYILLAFTSLRGLLFVADQTRQRNLFAQFTVEREHRLTVNLAVLSVFVIGLFQGGLLSQIMTPNVEPLFTDERSFWETFENGAFDLYWQLQVADGSYQSYLDSRANASDMMSLIARVNRNRPMRISPTMHSAFPAILNKSGVLFGKLPVLDYWTKRLCNVKLMKLTQYTDLTAGATSLFVFSKAVPDLLIERINYLIQLNRAGINRIAQRYNQRIEVDVKNLKRCARHEHNAAVALTLDQLTATFAVVLVGALLALIVLVWEHCKATRPKKRQLEGGSLNPVRKSDGSNDLEEDSENILIASN